MADERGTENECIENVEQTGFDPISPIHLGNHVSGCNRNRSGYRMGLDGGRCGSRHLQLCGVLHVTERSLLRGTKNDQRRNRH